MEYKRMWMPDEGNICLKKYRNKNLIIEHKTTNKGNDSGILKDWEAASKNKLPHCATPNKILGYLMKIGESEIIQLKKGNGC